MKPIIMSTEDVRKILDNRKTMFRQVMKPQPTYWDDGERLYDKDNIVGPEFYNPIRVGKDGEEYPGKEVYGIYSDNGEYGCKAPYKPGDVLWVRETWAVGDCALDCPGRLFEDECPFKHVGEKCYKYKQQYVDLDDLDFKWHSPVTMPREAARLFLRVKDVRVERLNQITNNDILREGFRSESCNICVHDGGSGCEHCFAILNPFRKSWDARNAKRGYGWDSNPLVWVIEFERVEKGAES